MRKLRISLFIILPLLLIALILFLGVSPRVRPINDSAESIAILEVLQVNDMKQWISVRGRKRNNPILLWLHGGPGSPQMPFAHYFDKKLEEDFVVVHWDQRGAGKSNHSNLPAGSMTFEQFLDDGFVVIDHLRDVLQQEKIYLLGHSWGTHLGIHLVNRQPDKFHAYIAVAQVVNHRRAVDIARSWLQDQMKKKNDAKGLAELGRIEDPAKQHSDYRKLAGLVNKYGGNFDISMRHLAWIAFRAPEYTLRDYIRLLNGMNRGGAPLHQGGKIAPYDFSRTIPKLEVPVYFFCGQNDYNTPLQLIQEYYEQLKSPDKKLIIFENSAHTPFFSEPEKFSRELKKVIKN